MLVVTRRRDEACQAVKLSPTRQRRERESRSSPGSSIARAVLDEPPPSRLPERILWENLRIIPGRFVIPAWSDVSGAAW